MIINEDIRSGFIPARQAPDQIKRAVDIISLLPSGCDKSKLKIGMMLSIDLQKASDSCAMALSFYHLG